MDFSSALEAGSISSTEALSLFDSLEAIDTDFMLGAWRGAGFPTDHPADGLLESYNWYGKNFDSSEQVHPLIHTTASGKKVSLNPIFMLPLVGALGRGSLPRAPIISKLLGYIMPLFSTKKGRARLRMIEYRGKSSATMAYDHLAINDVFRKVDDNTLLGIMDLKGMAAPFFFVLRREP